MHGVGLMIVVVLIVESIPFGILVSALLDSSLRRRERFALRVATFTVIQSAPAVTLIAGVGLGVVSEQTVGELLSLCVFWVFVSPAVMPVLLFHGPDRGRPSGENDDEGHGPGPDPNEPVAPRPIGGLPLPDAEQSRVRVREPRRPARIRRPRRPAREPDRAPSRPLSALRRRWHFGHQRLAGL